MEKRGDRAQHHTMSVRCAPMSVNRQIMKENGRRRRERMREGAGGGGVETSATCSRWNHTSNSDLNHAMRAEYTYKKWLTQKSTWSGREMMENVRSRCSSSVYRPYYNAPFVIYLLLRGEHGRLNTFPNKRSFLFLLFLFVLVLSFSHLHADASLALACRNTNTFTHAHAHARARIRAQSTFIMRKYLTLFGICET